jgi:DNA-binding IclR family transcriptional regulator
MLRGDNDFDDAVVAKRGSVDMETTTTVLDAHGRSLYGRAAAVRVVRDTHCGGDRRERLQALERGLEVLAFLNHVGAATSGQVASATGLKRATAHRILGVLVDLGLLRHDVPNRQYGLTARVRDLSGGFRDAPWVDEIAAPRMREWTRIQHWPLMLLTPLGTRGLIRVSTDDEAVISADRLVSGQVVPSSSPTLARLLDAFPPASHSPASPASADVELARIEGFVSSPTGCYRGGRIGVPVRVHHDVRGYVVMRCLPQMATDPEESRFWALELRALAQRIASQTVAAESATADLAKESCGACSLELGE